MTLTNIVNKIICGSALEVLKKMPAKSVNCAISSPPYWGLRSYGTDPQIWGGDKDCEHTWQVTPPRRSRSGKDATTEKQKSNTGAQYEAQGGNLCSKCNAWRGELGSEPTLEFYIDHLCDIYDEVKRVLRPDGTCWVNLGDTYGGEGTQRSSGGRAGFAMNEDSGKRVKKGIKEKSLCLIPQRFAIEMVNRGWILRNVIIWHKPNPMPSSAKDRFTVDFEYVYFFVKNKKYFFEPQYEPYQYDGRRDTTLKPTGKYPGGRTPQKMEREPMERWPNPLGRNKRTVWAIPTQPFPEAHFATFPEKLVEPMIKAGCPEFVCTKCGKAREKIYEPSLEYAKKLGTWTEDTDKDPELRASIGFAANTKKHSCTADYQVKGYSDCGCGEKFRPGIVLDPFMGSGTVGLVAAQNRRDWIGIELNQEYIEMAKKRIEAAETGVPVAEQREGQMPLFEGK